MQRREDEDEDEEDRIPQPESLKTESSPKSKY